MSKAAKTSAHPERSRVAEVVVEVSVAASLGRTWASLTEDMGAWWPDGFYTNERAKRFVLEPELGGRGYEDWGDGEGLVWFTVAGLERGRNLQCVGDLLPEFGGPGRVFTRYELEPDSKGCRVRLHQVAYGHLSESMEASSTEGWGLLLGALKAHAEKG